MKRLEFKQKLEKNQVWFSPKRDSLIIIQLIKIGGTYRWGYELAYMIDFLTPIIMKDAVLIGEYLPQLSSFEFKRLLIQAEEKDPFSRFIHQCMKFYKTNKYLTENQVIILKQIANRTIDDFDSPHGLDHFSEWIGQSQ